MSHSRAASIAERSADHAEAVDALLAFNSNRAPFVSGRKAVGAFRVAVVGDSMVYGQGLPHSKTLSQRLAAHLNGVLPGTFVEGISLGMCGACLFHALERVEDLALPLDPDLLLVAICCNDANMLRGQPPTNEEIGQTWIDFGPQVEHALTTFAKFMRGRAPRTAVLYFDRSSVYGSVRPPAILASICDRVGLAFIDGSEGLVSYRPDAISVSVADGHLNALANDIVARQVARFVSERGWLPQAVPFSEPAWLDTIRALPSRLQATGVPAAMAAAKTLSVLDAKWADRRNRHRHAVAPTHAAVRASIQDTLGTSLPMLAWSAFSRWLHEVHQPEGALSFAEARLYELGTIVSTLEYACVAGELGQDISELARVLGDDDGDSAALSATAIAVGARILAARQVIASALMLLPRTTDPAGELTAVSMLAVRVDTLLRLLERVTARAECLAADPRLPRTRSVERLRGYVERAMREGAYRITSWIDALPWRLLCTTLPAWTINAPVMTLEMVFAADPGTETWPFTVGIESRCPAYSGGAVHVGNLIRDGRPHAYSVELPFSLLLDVHLFFSGVETGTASGAHPIRIYPATLTIPGLEPRSLSRITLVNHSSAGTSFSYRSVFAFED